MKEGDEELGCGCDGGCDRRSFLYGVSLALGGMALGASSAESAQSLPEPRGRRHGAVVRAAFLYPPSTAFSGPDGWWSWPGNDFDAEGRQRQYLAAFREMEKRLGMKIAADNGSVANADQAQRLAAEIVATRPDGLLLVMFYNRSLGEADLLLKAAQEAGIPVVFYVGLGVKHGPVGQYRRPGVYFIQSLDNFAAIEYGMKMINAKKLMAQSRLLSINEAEAVSDAVEPFLGVTVRTIPFSRYAAEFQKALLGEEAKQFIARFTTGAKEIRGIRREALELSLIHI